MATATTRLSTSYTSMKSSSLHDLIEKFYTIVDKLKENHENEVEILNQKIRNLESENKHLRTVHEQHPHSIFDIDYVPNDSTTNKELQTELDRSRQQIDELQRKLNEQYSTCEDIRSKYNLQVLMNSKRPEQQNSDSDSNKIKELETIVQQLKDQIHQFDQCNYESDEQIRLLKQLISNNDPEQTKTITQSLTVKQVDLIQQTDIVENLLNKQEGKILEKIIELLEQNPRHDHPTTTKARKSKRKRF